MRFWLMTLSVNDLGIGRIHQMLCNRWPRCWSPCLQLPAPAQMARSAGGVGIDLRRDYSRHFPVPDLLICATRR